MKHQNMDCFNNILIGNKKCYWRYVSNITDETEEHHYRVAEQALEDYYLLNPTFDFFKTEYEPHVYFAPLEVLTKEDSVVVEWCENHGMFFD